MHTVTLRQQNWRRVGISIVGVAGCLFLLFFPIQLCARSNGFPTRVTGRVEQISSLPNPKRSPYPDCLVTARIRVEKVWSGSAELDSILIAMWGFRNRKYVSLGKYLPGDLVHLDIVPFADVPEVESIQRVDDITDLDLDMYWAVAVSNMSDSVTEPANPSAKRANKQRDKTRTTVVTAPSEHIKNRQQAAIQRELKQIQMLLDKHGGSWEAWHEHLQPVRDKLRSYDIVEQESWASLPLPFCRSDAFDLIPESQGGLLKVDAQVAMLIDLHERLAGQGIDLIVVPLPFREELALHKVLDDYPDEPAPVPYRMKVLHDLLDAGVEVINVLPKFFDRWNDYELFYYPGCNDHPADGALKLLATLIRERLERYQFKSLTNGVQPRLTRQRVAFEHTNESLFATQVLGEDGTMVSNRDKTSPVLLVGDSYTRYPFRSYFGSIVSADLASQLAYELGFPLYNYTVSAAAPILYQVLARAPKQLLAGRRVCLLVYSAYYPLVRTEDRGWNWEILDLDANRTTHTTYVLEPSKRK